MKRYLLLPLLILGLLLGGFGCKGQTAAEQAAVRPITLNYWTVYDDVPTLQAFATAYKAIRPYVTINIRQVRYEEFDKLFTNALADDVGPDIVSMHARWIGKYQTRLSPMPASVRVASITTQGSYVPEEVVTIDNQAMPTINAIRSNYVSTVANDVIWNGQVYGLPLALDTLALMYNKDLLDRAGVPLPPVSWEDFKAAIIKATKFDANGTITQYGAPLGTADNIENMPDILALLMLQNGAQMTRGNTVAFADGLSSGIPLEKHPAFQALQFYTNFARPTRDMYTWNDRPASGVDEFSRGRSVFYFGFAYELPRIRARAPQMNLEVVSVPQLRPTDPSNVANYWVESVVKKSKNQNEAWDFIRFMSQPDNIKKYTTATRQPSPLRSQLNTQKDDPILGPFALSVLYANNWYAGRNVDAATAVLKNLIKGFVQPYANRENPNERDANLLLNAARAMQQTM